MQRQPMPLLAPDPEQQELLCRYRQACLTDAARLGWRGFHCDLCPVAERLSPAELERDRPGLLAIAAVLEAEHIPGLDGDEHPRRQMAPRADVDELRAMLPGLPDRQRQVVERFVGGMTKRAIADQLGLPITTVETVLQRARSRARRTGVSNAPQTLTNQVSGR